MADEKRIIEIVVKAVGDGDLKKLASELERMRKEAASSRGEMENANKSLASMRKEAQATRRELDGFGKTFSAVSKAFGAGFVLTKLVHSSELVQDLSKNIHDLAGEFIDATFSAAGFTDALDEEFWMVAKQGARDLATAIGGVFNVANRKDLGVLKWMGPIGLVTLAEKGFTKYGESAGYDADVVGIDTNILAGLETSFARESEIEAEKRVGELISAATAAAKERLQVIEAMREWEERMAAEARAMSPAGLREAGADSFRHTLTSIAPDAQAFAREMENAARTVAPMVIELEAMGESLSTMNIETFGWTDALGVAVSYMKELNALQGDLANQAVVWGDALTFAFKGVLTGELHNTRDLLRSVATEMRNFYAELAAREAAEQTLSWIRTLLGAIGGGVSSGAVGGTGAGGGAPLNPNIGYAADGAAFNRGRVIPMAAGGIVTRPTLFPMANGLGLMGEAGPEAVMPLKRNRQGKLGVAASMPSITIVNNLGVAATASVRRDTDDRMSIVLEAAKMGADLAETRMQRSVSSGYGTAARSFESAYGVRRRT